MIKKIIKYKDLPFEVDKVYKTRFQTGELFKITNIKKTYFKSLNYTAEKIIGFEGIYLSHQHLGVCPLAVDRLIPEKVEDGFENVCEYCNKII